MNRLNIIVDILNKLGINDRILANNINNNFSNSFTDIYGRAHTYEEIRQTANQIMQTYRRM